MKKLLKRLMTVSMAVGVIGLSLVPTFASAASGGLLDGQPLKVYTDSTNYTLSTDATDNDTATSISLWSSNRYKKVVKEFDTPVNITSFYADYTTSFAGDLKAYFFSEVIPITTPVSYTSDPSFLGSEAMVAETPVQRSVDYQNVKMVVFHSNNGNNAYLKEFDVFGTTDAPDLTPSGNVGALTSTADDAQVTLDWVNPSDTDFSHVKIYRDDVLIADNVTTTTYTDTGLTNETTYLYKVTTVDDSGNESAGITTESTPSNLDLKAPGEVQSLSTSVTEDSITFNYNLPSDDDFALVTVYLDGVEHGTTVDSTYTINGLSPLTTYTVRITTSDMVANESTGTVRTIQTNDVPDTEPPSAPTNVSVINGNGSASVDWDNNLESDLDGYNVYVDGVKANTTPIRSSYYILDGLSNTSSYSITVTAIDKSGNESLATSPQTVTPNEEAMPLLSFSGYDLTDVADGVTSWFGALWLIVAFSVAIPLTFYIANRVKLMFLA